MSLTKRTYTEKQTVITAKNLNDIQDAIIENEIKKGPIPPANKKQLWLDSNEKGDFLAAYPVGAIYLSMVATSPKELFGGEWTKIEDTFLLACGPKYAAGRSGGEEKHTLSVEEMPRHRHEGIEYYGNGQTVNLNSGDKVHGYTLPWTGMTNSEKRELYTVYSGNSQSHNNMPPYLTIYAWYRIA